MFPFSHSLVVIPVVEKISGRRPNGVVGVVVGGVARRRDRLRRRTVSPLELVLRRGPEAPDLTLKVFEHSSDGLKPDDLSTLSGAILAMKRSKVSLLKTKF